MCQEFRMDDLLQSREKTVMAHLEAERRRDFDAALATFRRPRYELPGGEVVDGAEAVAEMYRDLHTGFPDLSFPDVEPTDLIHPRDSVMAETAMTGTHLGSFRGLPPTGRRAAWPAVVVFDFDGMDLVAERLYFDRLTILIQLGVARDPDSVAGKITTLLNHPLTLAKAVWRSRRSPG
jgi:steroid delta-isomerase-like uncharacterized protein